MRRDRIIQAFGIKQYGQRLFGPALVAQPNFARLVELLGNLLRRRAGVGQIGCIIRRSSAMSVSDWSW